MIKNIPIKHKIQLLAFLITITCTVVFTIYHYGSEKQVVIKAIDNKLFTAANAVPLILPEGYHERIENENSIPPEEQKKNLKLMSDYAKEVEVNYLYSFMKFGDTIVFTSCSATQDELETGEYSNYFDVYSTASKETIKAFDENESHFEEAVDEFGYFRSVIIPMKTPSGKTYLTGADIRMEFVQARLQHLLRNSITIGVVFFIIFFAISYIIANRIATPIVKLTNCTLDVVSKEFDFSAISTESLDEIIQNSKDEIGKLALTFKLMQQELQEYIVNLKETTAAKERIESELKIAHDIQMGLLPRAFPGAPKHPELDMHAMLEPAKEVGGDLYDSFEIDEERIFFIIGDVSDKGVPAALFMAVTKALFRAYGQENISLGEVVKTVNDELSRDNQTQMFVTVFCGIINLATGEIECCDGGHENPFILYHNDTVKLLEKKGGMALGFMPDTPYQSEKIVLEPGDTFFLYTDGVNEAMNTDREQFSVPRTEEYLKELCQASPEEITQHIMKKVHDHAGSAPQSDDITIFAIRYKGRNGDS